ncbi:MAG: VCBS repeat-containing protein [Planctomycetes bacterium]|nr:VCBS repeat-containing protein [Planctomycetota bacterium]
MRRISGAGAFAVATLFLSLGAAGLRGADCNSNGSDDVRDIASGASRDCNSNAVPDECELSAEGIAYEILGAFETGPSSSLVTEDFDGDGDLDLMLAELDAMGGSIEPGSKPGLAFVRNLGLGRFGDPVHSALASKPYTLHAGDLDGDADPDLLAVFTEDDTTGVLLNRGDGTFEGPVLYAGRPYSKVREVLADLDGDGDLDFVAKASNEMWVLVNRGDGSFDPGPSAAVDRPYYFKLADLDADGDLDIAVVTAGGSEAPESALTILSSDGAGGFSARETHDVGEYAQELGNADLDGDGDIDILVTRKSPPDIAVFMNRGGGRFDPGTSLVPGHTPTLVAVADVDGDSDADVLSASDWLQGDLETLAVFLNQGGGAFKAPALFKVGDEPLRIEVRDLNGDGRPEILVLNYFSGDLSVLRNLGGGALQDGVKLPIRIGGTADMRLADLDADGDLDVATAALQDGSLVVLENVSGGSFTRGCDDFRRGDVNTDGVVSISDIVMLRRWLFEGSAVPSCMDAADATDNEEILVCDAIAILDVLFRNPGWQASLPAPSPDPGRDPTPLGEPTYDCDMGGDLRAAHPLGCQSYRVEPPEATGDLLRIGDAVGIPGAPVDLPVYLSAEVSVDAVQLVVAYDPAVLVIDPEAALSFESTYFERFDTRPFGVLTLQPEAGLFTAAFAGNLLLPGYEVAPGDDILVAWIQARVKDGAPPGVVSVDPTNGPGGNGVGPYRMRNEITHKGAARFVSYIPRTIGGRLNIVGDQSLFLRADSNGDWKVDISDPIHTLGALFLGGGSLACRDAADSNDDGALDLSDAVFTLGYLFQGSRAPPEPFPEPGADPTVDALRCFRGPPVPPPR